MTPFTSGGAARRLLAGCAAQCIDQPLLPIAQVRKKRHAVPSLHCSRAKGWLAMMTACMAAPVAAQSTAADQWQFEVTPYLWASAMKGHVEAGPLPRVDIDMSFSDIWDSLDFGLMSGFEARKGRIGFLADAIYMKVSSGATARRTGSGPIGATASASADLEIEQTMLAAALAYRVSSGPTAIDVIGGARYSNIDAKANIEGSFFGISRSRSRSGDKDWVDPYVGIRVLHPLSERWTLTAYFDYGGFGVGSDSTWQAIAGAEYAFSKAVSLKFGYREMSVDYDKSGFVYDMRNKGAYLGVGIKF
jgi:opacity protein-like surface antigen